MRTYFIPFHQRELGNYYENFSENFSFSVVETNLNKKFENKKGKLYKFQGNIPKNTSNDAVDLRSRHAEVFLGKSVLKICSKFTGENLCRSTLLKSHF